MAAFEITHTTTYSYTRPVLLQPHIFRLRPRCDAAQTLARFELDIRPQFAGATQSTDLDGNVVVHAWFDGPTESLVIESRSTVEPLRFNPFDYVLTDRRAEFLPMTYMEPLKNILAPYSIQATRAKLVEGFVKSVADQTEWKTLRFLTAFNREIYETCKQTVREYGDPRSPEDTLASKEGSCRDLAVLFIDGCRHLGLAARFVSGYHTDQPADGIRRLHAWAEIYLPGAGWRGYDPSQGLATAERHVAIAAAAAPQLAAPVSGNFRGNGALSNLAANIDIRVVDERVGGMMQQMHNNETNHIHFIIKYAKVSK